MNNILINKILKIRLLVLHTSRKCTCLDVVWNEIRSCMGIYHN